MRRTNFLYIIVFLILWFLVINSWANTPTLPDPITQKTNEENKEFGRITSDYGPRNVESGNTNPHKGIDYALAKGGRGYCVESGDVKKINIRSGYNDSNITIGNWRYFHIADDYANNDYAIKIYYDQPVLDKNGKSTGKTTDIIVYREKKNNKWETIRALHVSDYPIFKFKDPGNNNYEITTSNYVGKNEWVFCARDYPPLNDTAGDHLHIDYNDGIKNPLQFICHKNRDRFELPLLI